MKKQFLRIALLFTILTGLIATVYGQPLIPDSCICYTDLQDMRCLECLINTPKKDSIIIEQTRFIEYQGTIITENAIQLKELERKKKRNLKIGLGIGGTGGFLIGIFLISLIK